MADIWEFVQAASQRTGLKPSTCRDLLMSGWTFTDTVDQPPRWVAPIANLKKE